MVKIWNEYKIRKSDDFQSIISKKISIKYFDSSFLIFYNPSNCKISRFGISIPRRIVKKAVKRNYYKRQIREMVTKFIKKNILKFNLECIIILKENFLNRSFKENELDLKNLLNKLNFKFANGKHEKKRF